MENLSECELQGLCNLRTFVAGDDEGGSEEEVIAAKTVDAALSGIGQNVFLKGGLADFFGDAGFFGKWFAGGFVFYEFDAQEQTEAADFANVGMIGEWSESLAELSFWFDAVKQLVGLEIVKDGVACGGGNGMGLIGEAVLECAGTYGESVGYASGD